MELIADKDGVDVIIAPVNKDDGIIVNLDFNFGVQSLHDLDHLMKVWNVKFKDGKRDLGNAKFSAYQFMADGVERRTISLRYLEVAPRSRGQRKSYDLMAQVINLVTVECDAAWGAVMGKPVVFIEKKHLQQVLEHATEEDRSSIFDFLCKIVEFVLDWDRKPHPQPDHDLVVTAIGEDITIQLIEGHMLRSA